MTLKTLRMPKLRRKRAKKSATDATTIQSSCGETQDHPTTQQPSCKETAATTGCVDHSGSGMLVSKLKEIFSAHVLAHPECTAGSVQAARYMRNKFTFYGIKAPERRLLQKQFLDAHKDVLRERSALMSLVKQLWAEEQRELQYVGVELVRQFRSELLGSSQEEFDEVTKFSEGLVTSKSWWDTVDALSYPVVGYCVGERKHFGEPLMRKWINADNMWMRRVAILHQLGMKHRTDEQLLYAFCLARSHETEFFIRKAIGWALREYAKSNKEGVKLFVSKNKDRLSPLSKREALKHC